MYVPMDEKHALHAQSPYSATKIGADKIAESYQLSFGLPVSIARPFNCYGPRQSSRAVIPTIVTQALTQSSVSLGNIDTVRDFTFVSDTVNGFIAIAENPTTIGKALNVGSGTQTSIRELTEIIFNLIGVECPVEIDKQRLRPEASEVDRLCADTALLQQLTRWEPKITLREGLSRTIDWVRNHLASYSIGSYSI
jgi:dTDP-glucose 4,6-dehydratase